VGLKNRLKKSLKESVYLKMSLFVSRPGAFHLPWKPFRLSPVNNGIHYSDNYRIKFKDGLYIKAFLFIILNSFITIANTLNP
jgi:hypothetical protein